MLWFSFQAELIISHIYVSTEKTPAWDYDGGFGFNNGEPSLKPDIRNLENNVAYVKSLIRLQSSPQVLFC